MLNGMQDTGTPVAVQDTTLALDVLGRFICNTWDEAVNNGGIQFDAVVIGSGMFGAYLLRRKDLAPRQSTRARTRSRPVPRLRARLD